MKCVTVAVFCIFLTGGYSEGIYYYQILPRKKGVTDSIIFHLLKLILISKSGSIWINKIQLTGYKIYFTNFFANTYKYYNHNNYI